MIQSFAQEAAGPTVHIAPQTITTFRGIPITNSMIFAWVIGLILIVLFITIARRMTLRPKGGLTQIVEIGTDFVTGMLDSGLNNRKKALKYTPYFAALFFVIAFSNIIGLLPGIGEALTYHGEPLFRASTADLNNTLAAATVAMVMVQWFAIRESGLKKHARHYFVGNLKNPLTYIMGFFEVFGEITRLGSLALRLFLNVAIGEIIIAIFSYLGKIAAPITAFPFLLLELGVCILQAYIFVMLSVTYLSVAVSGHGDDHDEDQEPVADTVALQESHG